MTLIVRALTAAAVALLGASPFAAAGGQDAQLRVSGAVRDTAGQPIGYAQVTIGKAAQRISDEQGRFEIAVRERGRQPVEVRRIGFRPVEFTLDIVTDTAVIVVMRPLAASLETVRIEADRLVRSLEIRGFYWRMEERSRGLGSGHFVTPEEIERRRVTRTTQYLEGIPGVRVVPLSDWTGRRFALLSNSRCPMTVYLNGSRLNRTPPPGAEFAEPPVLDEVLTPTTVGGIEVYTRANAPNEYQSMSGTCGVVVVWTK